MAVQEIKEFLQKDGSGVLKVILTPQKAFPNGSWFYCDAEDIDLVESYSWRIVKSCKTLYVCSNWTNIRFHQELAYKKLGHTVDIIDHYNHVGFDNCNQNLFNVTKEENQQNKFVKGYRSTLETRTKIPKIAWMVVIGASRTSFSTDNELIACQLRYQLEQERFKHPYNFIADRSQSLDILDLERTGQISSEEAIYRHVLRHADNAWYYHRYNLEEYFRDNNIPVPKYALDLQGYMIHPITGEKLCPLTK